MPQQKLAGLKKGAATLSVTDIKLAASLMALGILPVPGEEVSFVTGDAELLSFNFLPYGMVEEGGMTADEIVAAWKQEREATCREEEVSYTNPDHPLSYLLCALDNFLCVRAYVRKARAAVYMKRGKSVALIDPERTPKKLEEFILGRIGA